MAAVVGLSAPAWADDGPSTVDQVIVTGLRPKTDSKVATKTRP
jgi:hypothetical protein